MTIGQLHDLYWLGYLLTGDRERSLQTAIAALDTSDAANPFFEGWMVTWSRKIFIAKVLGRFSHPSPTAGARNAASLRAGSVGEEWPHRDAGKPELERALLAIDPLPRCAVVLSVFEKLPAEDIATLLNVNLERLRAAIATGLTELARNLAEFRDCLQTA